MSSTRRSSASDSSSTPNGSDERTPLLATLSPIPTNATIEAAIESVEEEDVHLEDEDAPLPFWQIMVLCYARVVEPIAFFSIFPYINEMIQKVGHVAEEDVGFYSGLIESLFSATQMCVMIFWGKAADRFGRKPCLVISLFGVTIATALFGTSTSIWQMILFRCMAGIFAGTLVTVRTMISENSTKKTQARAFSYFAFTGNLGICVGPFIGGLLERPAEKFPSTFGSIQFFRDYPYALPGFASASVGFTAGIVGALFLRETLHVHHRHRRAKGGSMSTWELFKYPGVARVLVIYNYIGILAFIYTAVIPVFLYIPIELGGIGFPPELIASAIGLNGISQAVWLLLVFPPLQRRINTGGVLRLCAAWWPVFFSLHPICHLFRRFGLTALFWSVGPLNLIVGSGVAMAFVGNQLALNDIAPTHETLGTLNAMALALSSGLRAVAPALATSLYAIGVKYHIADGQFFWIIAIILACGQNFIVRLLPKKAEGRIAREEDEEE
ncbi:MFS general substrate transporter [Westerdykella ornata]|uniref:MFS general substrate transporter n=1 Tax=Westerdykella ornata TaxID=318751 RepID=A0A6A6JDY1_WESOR|nr:MFS general substrate transporter [Westerdykella ornata]KAF2274208.1 MFS general substrate transporter [Westerdykella ornata]